MIANTNKLSKETVNGKHYFKRGLNNLELKLVSERKVPCNSQEKLNIKTMSAEEETELKNLVAQTLENKGILPKIRAELRANVFLALEENPSTKETLLKNDELSAFVKIPIGTLILNLIREFLEFFELEFTLSVFDPETKYGKDYNSLAKDKMMKELKITECKNKSPLLYEVIERVISCNDLRVFNKEKCLEDFGAGTVSESGDTGQLLSPVLLNSTYVKGKLDVESLSPIVKEGSEENENDTIKEELISNNISDSDSLAEINLDKSPRIEKSEENILSSNSSKDSKPNSPKSVPHNPDEIDLLTFTPVKETKPRENIKFSTLPINSEMKTNDKKENEKPMSILGDLPPLNINSEERGDKINKIKAIIDKWPGLENEESSLDSKSSRDQVNDEKSPALLKSDRSEHSRKSERTESADDFEEDISDLINGHNSLEGQLTIDETISKLSCEADYLESI